MLRHPLDVATMLSKVHMDRYDPMRAFHGDQATVNVEVGLRQTGYPASREHQSCPAVLRVSRSALSDVYPIRYVFFILAGTRLTVALSHRHALA